MPAALNLRQAFLCGKGRGVILRMLAQEFAEGQRGIGLNRRVEADEQGLVFIDALQRVHPVGHGDVVIDISLARPAQEIPRCPGALALGHQPGIPMQIDRIGRIADRAQNGTLALVRIRQHRQRLIAVRSDDDMVVAAGVAVAVVDEDAMGSALDRGDGAAELDLVAEVSGQFLDIALAAALHRAPDRTVMLQQAMVGEECDKVLGREIQHLARRRRPDRRAHRRQIVGQQPRGEMTGAKIFAERQPGELAGGIVLHALLVEGQDVAEHPEIGGRQKVARLSEQASHGFEPVAAATLPLKAAGVRGHRKAHATVHGLDAQMGEQCRQVRIVQFVVNDEADVDR